MRLDTAPKEMRRNLHGKDFNPYQLLVDTVPSAHSSGKAETTTTNSARNTRHVAKKIGNKDGNILLHVLSVATILIFLTNKFLLVTHTGQINSKSSLTRDF
jgi:hypothetical protein